MGDFRDGRYVPAIEAIKALAPEEPQEALRKLWPIEPQFRDLVMPTPRYAREFDCPLPAPALVKINDDNVVLWIGGKIPVNKRMAEVRRE